MSYRPLFLSFEALQKIAFGFLAAAGALFYAAFLELRRHNAPILRNHDGKPLLSSCKSPMKDLSVFHQIPQYTLVGIAEILAVVPGQ